MRHLLFVSAALALSIIPGGASARTPLQAFPTTPDDEDSAVLRPAPMDITDTAEEVAGEIAIDLKDDASDEQIADFATRYGLALRPNSAWSTHDKLEVADVDVADEDTLLDKMAHDPLVEHAEKMALLHAYFVPNDPL